MTTLKTAPLAASLALLCVYAPQCVSSSTNVTSIRVGQFVYDSTGCDNLLSTQRDEFTDSDEVIRNLVTEFSLQEQKPAAHAWVSDQFYSSEAPTLAYLRLKRGLTQAALAASMGVPQSSISRLENGQESPTIERAKKMADALGVTLDAYYAAHQETKRIKAEA